jgi:hypothetical protein
MNLVEMSVVLKKYFSVRKMASTLFNKFTQEMCEYASAWVSPFRSLLTRSRIAAQEGSTGGDPVPRNPGGKHAQRKSAIELFVIT